MKYLKTFENRMGNMTQLAKLGLMDDDLIKVYRYLEEIKDPDRFAGRANLELENYSHESLPPELTHVMGNLNLIGSKIKSLPTDFRVDGYLWLHSSSIESLPSGLRVGKTLILDSSAIRSLPGDLIVGGAITLADTQNLTQLPQRIDVGRGKPTSALKFNAPYAELTLGDSFIEALPENFHCTGSLDLSGSRIEELPEGLTVGGNLYVRYSNVDLERLPSHMEVKGDLQVTRNQWMSIGQRTRDRLYEMVGDIDIS